MNVKWADLLEGCEDVYLFNDRIKTIGYDSQSVNYIYEKLKCFLIYKWGISRGFVKYSIGDKLCGKDFWDGFRNFVTLPSIRCIKGK